MAIFIFLPGKHHGAQLLDIFSQVWEWRGIWVLPPCQPCDGIYPTTSTMILLCMFLYILHVCVGQWWGVLCVSASRHSHDSHYIDWSGERLISQCPSLCSLSSTLLWWLWQLVFLNECHYIWGRKLTVWKPIATFACVWWDIYIVG